MKAKWASYTHGEIQNAQKTIARNRDRETGDPSLSEVLQKCRNELTCFGRYMDTVETSGVIVHQRSHNICEA